MISKKFIFTALFLLILNIWTGCLGQRNQQQKRWKRVNDPTRDTLAHRRKRLLETWPQFIIKEAIMKTDSGARGLYPEFSRLVKYLSALTHVENLPLDFVIVGACTGKMDNFIDKFLVMPHWRGVFIEPDEVNYNVMVTEFAKYNISPNSERAYVVRSAISNSCVDGHITMFKPNTSRAETNASHAIMHEMGSMSKDLVQNSVKHLLKTFPTAAAGETGKSNDISIEMTVPCQPMEQVLHAANKHFTTNKTEIFTRHLVYNASEYVTFVPMVVRVDTEGHDAIVLNELFMALDKSMHNIAATEPQIQAEFATTALQNSLNVEQDQATQYNCEFSPLLLFWEQNKLSKGEYTSLNDALHIRGYHTHEDYFIGRWRAQDMYAVLSPQTYHYNERCKDVPLEEGVFL